MQERKSPVYRELGGLRTYRKWPLWKKGDCLEGVLLKKYTDKFGGNGYELEVTACDFADKDAEIEIGRKVGINGCGSIDYKLEAVEIGTPIQLLYNGKSLLTSGKFKGTEAHDVIVKVPEEVLLGQKLNGKVSEEVGEEEEFDL